MSGPPCTNYYVTIDRFKPGDECGVIDLIVAIQREEFKIAISPADQPDLLSIPEFYQTGTGDFWVARVAGQIVGTIGLKDIGSGAAALRKMFVAKAHRGPAGVAAKLLEHLLSTARARKLRHVYLGTTAAFIAAHRFYEKNGFRRLAPEGLPPSFPRMAVDTIFYELDLD